MDGVKNVVLFGGQGSPSLFSPHTASIASHDAQSSSAATILLSRCHAAFLEEVFNIGSAPTEIFGSEEDFFSRPAKLLAPDPVYHDNPIIQGTTICLYQLLRYISSVSSFPSVDLDSYLQQTCETAGFCSGILTASVVSSSKTIQQFIDFGVEAFRLAFWVGYRSSLYCQKVLGCRWKQLSWSLVVLGVDRKQMLAMLEEFRQFQPGDLHVAAISSEQCITLSGQGPVLNAFKTFCSKSATAKFAHVHALYHGGAQMQVVLDEVCQDLHKRNIRFPSFQELYKPLRSTLDGTYLRADGDSSSLVKSVLRLMLVDCVDWTKTSDCISKSILESLERDPSSKIRILALGPGSQSILREPSRRLRNHLVETIDLSSPPIPTRDPSAVALDGIAIVGMGVNYPNGKDADTFWDALTRGLNSIPISRFRIADFYEAEPSQSKTRKMKIKHGNFIEDVWGFDNAFFNISPREAKSMDPQQRILLHTTQAAMEDAGYVKDSTATFQRRSFGCFIGVATGDYEQNLKDDIDIYNSPGNLRAFLSGKISYAYQMSGPSVVVDTACSSSLVAIYQACRALQNKDCSAALAGGVNVICGPDMYLGLSRAHFLSPTGQCKCFDASADGYCRGEGCGVFVLKRLSDAVAEGDRIHGVIRGVEMNQSGESHSITHPHAETQTELFETLLTKTRVDPDSIGVVEAHGTGTQAGDFTEISSIHSTFAKSRSSKSPLIVSSIKGNIGHTEAASGAAGLTKLLLMLRKKSIPVQASFQNLNPRLNGLVGSGIAIPLETQAWESPQGLPRRALLNNFGAAGSNAALILEEYLVPALGSEDRKERSAYPFNISAQNERALEETVERYKKTLMNKNKRLSIKDVCYTATARRQMYEHRISMVCCSVQDLLKQLKSPTMHTLMDVPTSRPIIFVFSGQGSSYFGMGKELMETSPLFREIVTSSNTILQALGLEGILDVLENDDEAKTSIPDNDREVALQCACLAVEYALARLFISWSVKPDIVMGHSLGEYAALAISGAIAWEDCLRIVALRAQTMVTSCSANTSGMLACRMSAEQAESLMSESGQFPELSVACQNSVNDCVVSGGLNDLSAFQEKCVSVGHKATRLKVPYGYHSKFMDPIVSTLKELGTSIAFLEPTIPVASTVLGRLLKFSDLDPQYFARHARQPVRFLETVQHLQGQRLLDGAVFLEIGPHPITLPMIKSTLQTDSGRLLSSLHKNHSCWVSMSNALCQLSLLRVDVSWREVFKASEAKLVDMPNHPLAKTEACVPYERSASEKGIDISSPPESRTKYSLLPNLLATNSVDGPYIFETRLSTLAKYICGHAVGGVPICPASVFVELALEAAQSASHSPQDAVYVVRDLSFASPLVYDPSNEHQTIRLVLMKSTPGTDMKFKIVSPATSTSQQTLFCSGAVTTENTAKTKSGWIRDATVVKRQQSHLFVENGINLNTFRTKMIYETIFPRVVTYSSDYHSLIYLSVAASGNEGYGSFKVPDQIPREAPIALPAFTDTLLHAAGFIANTGTRSIDAYICGKVESVQLLYKEIDFNETFTVYCSLFDDNGGTIVADSVALDSRSRIAASIQGMQFKKVRLSAFKAALERNLRKQPKDQPSSLGRPTLPPSPPETLVASSPATPREGAMPSQAIQMKIIRIIMDCCGASEDAIRSAQDLAVLGIDSLMSLELLPMFQQSFPGQNIELSMLERCKSLRDLEMALGSASIVSSLGSSSHRSSGDDERTPICTDKCDDNASGRIRGVIASVCDINQAEIVPHKSLDSLGVDSLLSIELHRALSQALNLELSPDDVSHSQTVDDLESLASRSVQQVTEPVNSANRSNPGPRARKETGLTTIQTDGSGKLPLYLFHDGSGFCNMYSRLDSMDRNLHGFSNPSAFTDRPAPDTLVQMAADYASAINTSTRSPIILGGWSFGGVLAFEAARALKTLGTPVRGIILIDSPYPINHPPLPNPIIEHIANKSRTQNAQDTTKQELMSQFRSNASLLASYECRKMDKFEPTVVYLRSRDVLDCKRMCGVEYPWLENQRAREEAVEKWRELVGQVVEVLEIPGNHFEVFAKENVAETKKQIKKACEIIERGA